MKRTQVLIFICLLGAMACSPAQDESLSSASPVDSEAIHSKATTLPGTGTKVRSSNSTWVEEQFVTEIVNVGLAKLGYEIADIQQADYAALHLAVANGDLDYTTGFYNPGHEDFFQEAGGEAKLEKLGVLVTGGGLQGNYGR